MPVCIHDKVCIFIATTAFSKYKIESLFEIGIPINILQLLRQCPCYDLDKVRSFLQNSWAILSSFKTVFIFNDTSAEIKKKSADVLLKMIILLSELKKGAVHKLR